MTAIGGSCLCGGVKFEITGRLSSPLNCHCSQCRKQHGAPFRSRVRVQVEDFRWLQGEHLIKYYESAGGYLRGFCRECGSPIINWTPGPLGAQSGRALKRGRCCGHATPSWAAGKRGSGRARGTPHQVTGRQQATTSPKTQATTSQPSDGQRDCNFISRCRSILGDAGI
jgi:hypothetical protein